MTVKDFIGKRVIGAKTGRRYILSRITAPYISVKEESADKNGNHPTYRFECINGDPFSLGSLLFEDSSLAAPFKKAYEEHCQSKDRYWENYEYWMRKG